MRLPRVSRRWWQLPSQTTNIARFLHVWRREALSVHITLGEWAFAQAQWPAAETCFKNSLETALAECPPQLSDQGMNILRAHACLVRLYRRTGDVHRRLGPLEEEIAVTLKERGFEPILMDSKT